MTTPATELWAAAQLLRDKATAAILGPATGLALADWLEWQAAALADGRIAVPDAALAYARQVLGTTTGQPETARPGPDDIQVWPLCRVLADVRCGSKDWSWDEEWADLDRRHAESGYLERLEQQIRVNGITMPVLIGSDGRLWDGHHRLRIAVRLGIGYVPVEITSPNTGQPDTVAPAVDRATVLREAANGLAALGPLDSLVSAPAAWTEAIETLRRMADQIAEDDRSRLAAEAQQPAPCGRSAAMSTPCSAGDHCCQGADETQRPTR